MSSDCQLPTSASSRQGAPGQEPSQGPTGPGPGFQGDDRTQASAKPRGKGWVESG